MRHHLFHGCGFGAVEPNIATPLNSTPPAAVTAPTPAPQIGPNQPIPGVHNGVEYGILGIPVAIFPFDPHKP
jgi:hypothetical protein